MADRSIADRGMLFPEASGMDQFKNGGHIISLAHNTTKNSISLTKYQPICFQTSDVLASMSVRAIRTSAIPVLNGKAPSPLSFNGLIHS